MDFRPPLRSVFISDEAKTKRFIWTNFHIQNHTSWKNVVFSDESWFLLGRNKKWLWVDRHNLTPEVFSNTQSHPKKIMIWCAIWWNFKSNLVIFDKSVNSEVYIDDVIFNSNVVEDADARWGVGNWIFQQDNAPSHNSKVTKAVLKELDINVLDWPPYSTDLNVIEVVWAIMEKRIEKINPKNIDELKQCISDVWEGLTWQIINGLINTMESRIQTVNANPGQTIYRLNSVGAQ